jgi:hypothetical protein
MVFLRRRCVPAKPDRFSPSVFRFSFFRMMAGFPVIMMSEITTLCVSRDIA